MQGHEEDTKPMGLQRYKRLLARGKKWKGQFKLANEHKSTDSQILDFIKSNKLTEQDYIDLHSGLYNRIQTDQDWGWHRKFSQALSESKWNRPTTNKKTLDSIYDIVDKLKTYGVKDYDEDNDYRTIAKEQLDAAENLMSNFKLSKQHINELLNNEKYWHQSSVGEKPFIPDALLENANITKDHLYRFAKNFPDQASRVITHKESDDRLHNLVLGSPEKIQNTDSNILQKFLQSRMRRSDDPLAQTDSYQININPKLLKNLIEHGNDKLHRYYFHQLMQQLPSADRTDFINRKLGITDGRPMYDADTDFRRDNPDPEDLKWDNWQNGDQYDKSLAKLITQGNYLDHEHIEHIKHHGDFDQKYDLYHNKNIDPQHGIEMFHKWHDDHGHHGYDAEQLQERFKEDKDDIYTPDDLDENTLEDIREDIYNSGADSKWANESYPFSEWFDDNIDEIVSEISDNQMPDSYHKSVNKKLKEDYDWEDENPNSKQNIGDPKYDALDDLYTEYKDRGLDNYLFTVDELKNDHGVDVSNYNIKPDEDGDVDGEDLLKALNGYGGPSTIDYANDDEYTIQDHPDFDDRYNEISDDLKRSHIQDNPYDFYNGFYDDYYESNGYQEAQQEAMSELIPQYIKDNDHYAPLYATSHQDDRFIPEHIIEHMPELAQIRTDRERKLQEASMSGDLKGSMKNRSHEHDYGEDQHYYEMVKDYADANGGSIDIGRMHKMFPAQKDTWKKIFGGKGKITSDEVGQKIEQIPKTQYNISYGQWNGSAMQNINERHQMVIRLDHSNKSIEPLKNDPELYDTFKKIQNVSKRSGHPTNNHTIAWARVDTSNPKHWFIDEVQSDFGKTVTRYLKENNAEDKARHVQKISDYHKNWREVLTNHIIKEAKKHNIEKISTHSPESKAAHTGSYSVHTVYKDSYQKIPRKMGFKPAKHEELAVSNKVKQEIFQQPLSSNKPNAQPHQGHVLDLNPKIKKHELNLITDLIKFEIILEKSSNSNIKDRCKYNITLIKSILNIEDEDGLHICISIQDDELDFLEKSQYYDPTKEGQTHPTKPYVATQHPEGQLMWHHNEELANKNDRIINDPSLRQKFLDKLPSTTHKAAFSAIMDRVSQDPNRHFIPSRDGGRDKMRARHIKTLLLSPERAKIDLDRDNVLNISLPRHGYSGGFTTWKYALKPKKVVKNESTGLEKYEQRRDFKTNERVRFDRDLRQYAGSRRSVRETRYTDIRKNSGHGEFKSLVSGRHLVRLNILKSSLKDQKKSFNPTQDISGKHIERLKILQKSDITNKVKAGLAATALVTGMAGKTQTDHKPQIPSPKSTQVITHDQRQETSPKKHIMDAIMAVESSGGKDTKHARLPSNSIHHGERAYGKYGLTPLLMRETIKKHKDLAQKYNHMLDLRGDKFQIELQKHPELEDVVANRHYDRLVKHFGHNVDKIAMAWLNGITGTKQAIKNRVDLNNHWHVKKVRKAYENILNNQHPNQYNP